MELAPVAAVWSSWLLSRVGSVRSLVDSWDTTTQAYFVLGTLLGAPSPATVSWKQRVAWILLLARHSRFRMHLRLPSCILHGPWWSSSCDMPTRSKKQYSSHPARIIELRFLDCLLLFFFLLRCTAEIYRRFWPLVIWSRRRVNFCQSFFGPHASFERFLL